MIENSQKIFERFDSVGQKRMSQLHKGSRDSLEISPNLWAGVGLVRGGAGTALVGSAENVAARMKEYEEIGIESFVLSGYPHLEEAYRVAELLFPLLPVYRSSKCPFRKRRVHSGKYWQMTTTLQKEVKLKMKLNKKFNSLHLISWIVPILLLVTWQLLSLWGFCRNGYCLPRLKSFELASLY